LQYVTYSYRLKDKHQNLLGKESKLTNIVWNFCNITQIKAVKEKRQWLSIFDLHDLTSGSIKEFNCQVLDAQGIQQICAKYVTNRQTFKKPWLRFRGKKSLGWILSRRNVLQIAPSKFKIGKLTFDCLSARQIPKSAQIIQCSFNQDNRNRWFLNITFKIEQLQIHRNIDTTVGIDLGLKTMATLSDGQKIEPLRSYQNLEKSIGQAQKANKKKLVQKLHKKTKNQRADYLHKLSAKLTKDYEKIYVGDVNSKSLAKTKMSKSVLDASWSSFRHMLSYKSLREGGKTVEVSERFTTQICSICDEKPQSRPKGIAGLGIREWKCDNCNTVHDRDVNAARNILRFGQKTLTEGVMTNI
jgi:putative transposase